MKITNYMVVTGMNVQSIEGQVRGLIKQGWQPHGSIVALSSGDYNYAQVMVFIEGE